MYKNPLKHSIQKLISFFFLLFAKLVFVYEYFSSVSSKSICIRFTNFADIPHDFFIEPLKYILSKKNKTYKLVNQYTPNIEFFSVFGEKNDLLKSKATYKIFFTGENTNDNSIHNNFRSYKGNCTDVTHLSFGFDFLEKENYSRLPLWILYYFKPYDSKDIIKNKLDEFKFQYKKDKFCALIARHDSTGLRAEIYKTISAIDHIDCAGYLFHNDDTLKTSYNDNKAWYLQRYKFNICPENSNSYGYITEKLFQSLYSGCIPIYNGGGGEPDIINPDIILWFEPNTGNNELLNEIKKLHSDDKLFTSFMNKDYFLDTAVDKIYFYLQRYVNNMQELANKI
jgi:hypothetical protein